MASREACDLSEQNLTEVPVVPKMETLVSLDVSKNVIQNLPNMSGFTSLRSLDLSHNNIIDITPLSSLKLLRELNISNNRIVSLAVIGNLSSLEVLNASYNRITTIAAQMPDSLLDCDISYNEMSSVEFLQHKFPVTMCRIDFTGNMINNPMELRYLAVFPNITEVGSGMVDRFRDLHMIPYLKHVCPSVFTFDGIDVIDAIDPEGFPSEDDLFEVLMNGDETVLRQMLQKVETKVEWAAPSFVPFEEEFDAEAVRSVENLLERVERKIDTNDTHQVTPSPNAAQIREMRAEVAEMKEQLSALLRMLYVHDQAVRNLIPDP